MKHSKNKSLDNLIELYEGIIKVEKWRHIPNYHGLFKVSTFGRIKRLERLWPSSTGYRKRKEEIIIPTKNPFGYLYVELYNLNGERTKAFVHVLVAKAWLKNKNSYPEVDHKWGDKEDNRVSELEWVTKSENQKRAYRLGRKPNKTMLGRTGSNCPHSRLINQLSLEGKFIKNWTSQKEAANALGLSQGNIFSAIKGTYKQTGGYKWEYAK